MSVVLELGPGEIFLFDTPGGTTTNHLPEGLRDLEAGVGPGRSIQAIYSLSFGCNGAYVLAARNVNGAIIRRNDLPPKLESWLIDPITNTCKRDIATLSVEFGPNGSFYARDKDSYRWHNLPDALEEAIQQRLCPAGWMARPDFVVLGADGAFIYSNDCGGCSHALGNYPILQDLILRLQRSNVGGLTGFALVQCVSMSIYRPGQFILLHNSGQLFAELSPTATQALNSMARTFPVRNFMPQRPPQRVVSQPVKPTSPTPVDHTALPIRKPVGSAPGQPRPQAPHLVSSPIPQTHSSRPVSYAQNSAPAVPQVQSNVRPVSMQLPGQNPGRNSAVQQQTYNLNSNQDYNYNSNTNINYTTTDADTSSSGTQYAVANNDGTHAPTYPIDLNLSTTTVDNSNIYDATTNDTTTYTTIVGNSGLCNNTTSGNTAYNTIDTINNSTYTTLNTSDDATYTTTTDSTAYNIADISTTSGDSADAGFSTGVDGVVADPGGGDGAGLWSNLFS